MTRAKAINVGLWLALILLPLILEAAGERYWITLMTRMVILGLVALSLDLLIGQAGLVSFGHAAFFGAGGYAVAVSAHHAAEGLPLFGWSGSEEALVTWPLAMLVGALLAFAIGTLALRTRGVNFIMITLAFAQMLFFVFVALEGYGGDDGLLMYGRNTLLGLGITRPLPFYYVCLAALALTALGLGLLLRSRFGIALKAAKASERRVLALGYPVFRLRLWAFVIAGALAALGGALWANQARFVSPDMLSWLRSGELIVMVVLGGTGTLMGPIAGAAALVLMEAVLAGWTEHWMIVLGPLLVLVALSRGSGLHGLLTGQASGPPR